MFGLLVGTSTKNASIINKKGLITNNNVLKHLESIQKKRHKKMSLFYYRSYTDNSWMKNLSSLLVNKSKLLLFWTYFLISHKPIPK